MRLILISFFISILSVGLASGDPKKLSPGGFEWQPELSPSGPLLIVCSLDDQMLYAFRNGVQIGRSSMVLGSPENPASTGVFYVLHSDVDPASRVSKQKDLPFVRQLAWTGISIPAPAEIGRPKSRDSIQLPPAFSKKLYAQMKSGATVAITKKNSVPTRSNAPSTILLQSSSPEPQDRAIPKGRAIWEPHKSTTGAISILLSYADKTLYVWRSGIQIGQCPVAFGTDAEKLPGGAFLMLDGPEKPNPKDPTQMIRPWSILSLTGSGIEGDAVTRLRDSLLLNTEFREILSEILEPGTLFLATHHSSTPENQLGGMNIGTMDDLPDPE